MNHVPSLISDLALILCAAGVITIIFKRLKQPVVLGYILAGLLVGPNVRVLPSVVEAESIKIWAEIGVIFLLFNLGLEFSFKKLVTLGHTVAITGLIEVVLMFLSGYTIGTLLGWSLTDSIFLGGIISISSTTIIIRTFDELGLRSRNFTNLVLGVLIIEDLVAVLLMVLLTTLGLSNQFSGMEMLKSVGKLLFFLTFWFLGGIFIFPTFFRVFKKYMNDETLLLTSIALCFVMVLIATSVGFSSALGAFIMGSILAETSKGERIEHVLKPVKELFGAIFFVSVGMLIDPATLMQYAVPLVILVLTVILGKTIYVTLGMLVAGQTLRSSLQSGLSMSQIGEFSFIIASLGLSMDVTSEFLYPVAVGVSVITTFTTPYCVRLSEPLSEWLRKILPNKWYDYLNRYSNSTIITKASGHWNEVLKAYSRIIVINSVVILGIFFLTKEFAAPIILERIENPLVANAIIILGSLLTMGPFLWALVFKRSKSASYKALWSNRRFNRGPLVVLELSRVLLALIFIIALVVTYFTQKTALVITLLIVLPVFALFYRLLKDFYNRIEARFIANLSAKSNTPKRSSANILPPWDVHLARFVVSPDSSIVGEPLSVVKLREKFGVNVALISRGTRQIVLPKAKDMLFPNDEIEVIGTDDQLAKFRPLVDSLNPDYFGETPEELHPVSLVRVEVKPAHDISGRTIRDSQVLTATSGLLVGLERNGRRMLNPESSQIIYDDDVLWIAGDKDRIKNFFNTPRLLKEDSEIEEDEFSSGTA